MTTSTLARRLSLSPATVSGRLKALPHARPCRVTGLPDRLPASRSRPTAPAAHAGHGRARDTGAAGRRVRRGSLHWSRRTRGRLPVAR
ncbi:hypothetical protein ACFQYP_63170 [Nonomuraea antimicrobica]|uniref:hypothetical protein n=1 Tax=Nonomuraea antimicrobica TaxID=561173 RepID=UPI0031E8EEB9